MTTVPRIAFRRLSAISPDAIIELMTDPVVRRHMPLARGAFGRSECERFVASKERIWTQHGHGPWAFVIDGALAGWGGLQPEGNDVDLALVLHPRHWGIGRGLCETFIAEAFEERGLDSITVLLPPSRTRVAGMRRLGFRDDGEVSLGGERFRRFRLTSSDHRDRRRSFGT